MSDLDRITVLDILHHLANTVEDEYVDGEITFSGLHVAGNTLAIDVYDEDDNLRTWVLTPVELER